MNFYPYDYPLILTDSIFTTYGGNTGSSVSAQRQAAYVIAEEFVSDDIGSFLLPTIITGTFLYIPHRMLILDNSYISRVILTRFISEDETIYSTVSGTANLYVHLSDDVRGVVQVDPYTAYCGCGHRDGLPYKVQIVYETGLPTGVASTNPKMLLALTASAEIALNEIIGYGNESVGDIGVQEFRNQQYSEKRVGLIRTVFGTSARAQFIHKLLTKFRKYRYVGL